MVKEKLSGQVMAGLLTGNKWELKGQVIVVLLTGKIVQWSGYGRTFDRYDFTAVRLWQDCGQVRLYSGQVMAGLLTV